MADQPDDPMDLTDLPLPSRSNILTEGQDAAASTSATPFAAPKSKAHKQRVYRQRIAASRTPAQAISARKSDAERQRNCRLRKTVNSALVSGSLESTTSSFRSGVRSNNVLTGTQRQLKHHLRQPSAAKPEQSIVQPDTITWKTKWASSILRFKSTFLDNDFGYACSICDRLWFKNDLKPITADQLGVISEWYIKENRRLCREEYKMICKTCKRSLNKKTMPPLAKVNGFSYPDQPPGLPPLDPISERLISPRLPFMQVRRLHHDFSYGIIGQVINVPVDVQEMVKCLPRHLNEDDVINVNIKRNLAHKSDYISKYMSKSTISAWLTVLQKSSLYRLYEINVDLSRLHPTVPFLEDKPDETSDRVENISAENMPESEILASRQHTMMWNEEDFLNSAPEHLATPVNVIYDRHAEELSFPWIYFGEPRRFNTRIPVTPYMIANSEIRRRDRRGATPQKILYMLVTSSMKMLKSKQTYNPFGKYFVKDYFLCIEFNHRGSPHAHILLWLNDDPRETVSENMPRTIDLVEKLSSVAREDVPNNSVYANQIHEHTFTCTKQGEATCRFGIPYWPMPTTRVLIPMPQSDGRRQTLQQKAKELRTSLGECRYACMDEFLKANGLTYVTYLDIVRSTLRRPTLVFRRNFDELMTITFNLYLAGELNSNIDIQFILDEYSCAEYIVEYVNKSARGMGNLRRELTTMMQKHPERDYTGQLKALSIKLVNAVEMSAQEAAWYLLRQPMSETSRQVMYIPTVWPTERQCCRKRRQQMDREGIDGDSTDVWTKSIIQRYEERPASLEQVYLAEFAAWYANANDFVDEEDDEHVDDDEDSEAVPKARSSRAPKEYRRRLLGRVIRYRRYHIDETVNYKREMVLLYVQFRNEMSEIVDQNKFLQLFNDNKDTIMERHSLFETNLNIENVMKELEETIILENDDKSNLQEEKSRELFGQRLGEDCVEKVDDVNQMAPRPGFSVVKKRSNVMTKQQYCDLVRTINPEQKKNILEIIHRLHGCDDDVSEALQIFFPSPADCGKTYTLKCLMETYNRYKQEHNSMNNAYIASASKGTVPLDDTTVPSAFRLTSSCVTKLLSTENLQAYRNMFVGVKTVYVDEISMLSSAILQKINYRLQQITGIYDKAFGGIHVILCGDFRQLPPVRTSPCYSLSNNQLGRPILRHDIDYSPLVRVERQTDERFSTILNKIRDGIKLSIDDIKLIQSRHKSEAWCKENVPNAVRLYYSNTEVDSFNQSAVINAYNCLAHDIMIGYASEQEKAQCSDKLHKMTIAETDGLPYLLPLDEGYPYMITSNIDDADGLVNGAIGVLRHIERQQSNVDDHSAEAGPSTSTTLPASQEEIITLWFEFPEESTGASAKIKCRNHVQSKPNTLSPDWVPVYKNLVDITLSETVKCKRKQFPCVAARAITIDKSQSGTFDAIVYKYSPIHPQQIVYEAMSRVRNIEDLHIITDDDAAFIFKHGRDGNDLQTTRDIPNEYVRLHGCALPTIRKKAVKICDDANNDGGTVGTNLDAQSLFAHSADIEMDTVIPRTPSSEAPTAIVKAEPLDELLEATSKDDFQTFENLAENEGVIVKVENQDLFESHINIKSEADAHKTEITENIADTIHDPAYQDSQQYRQDDRTPSSEALTAIVKAEPLDELLEATSEHDSQTFENLAENEGVIVKVENQDLFESHINIKSEADADQTEITENIEDSIHNPAYQDSQQYRQDDRTPSIEVPTAIVKAEPLDELLEGSPLQGIGDIVTEHDSNQMEVDDETTKDHVQNPRHMIGDRLNQAPKTSTERGREYRARKALLKQQIKRQLELDAIKSASEDNEDPGPSEIMTLEKKRAKSAEATRRWREKKRAANKTPKNPAKSAAQLMREYRARKKMAASQSKQKPAVMVDSESLLATLRLMAENDPLKMETDNFECSENSDYDSDIVKEELDISDEGYG